MENILNLVQNMLYGSYYSSENSWCCWKVNDPVQSDLAFVKSQLLQAEFSSE